MNEEISVTIHVIKLPTAMTDGVRKMTRHRDRHWIIAVAITRNRTVRVRVTRSATAANQPRRHDVTCLPWEVIIRQLLNGASWLFVERDAAGLTTRCQDAIVTTTDCMTRCCMPHCAQIASLSNRTICNETRLREKLGWANVKEERIKRLVVVVGMVVIRW